MERQPRRLTAGRALVVAIAVALSALVGARPGGAETGVPDAYGYVWVDSRVPSPIIPYAWVDIVPTGTLLPLGHDDCTFDLGIGFQFRFYGTLLDRVFVCANGFLSFSLPSFMPDPPIPDPREPNDRIVGLGMDLDPSAGGNVYIKSFAATTPRRFIVTWDAVLKEFTTNRRETFQIILEQNTPSNDGRIIVQYKTLQDIGTPLVGIENRTGSSGLPYSNALENGHAVAFLPPSDAGLPPDTLTATPASLAPGVVVQGTADVAMARIDLVTGSNDVAVAAVRVRLSGVGAGPEDVSMARLWLDNGNGTFEPSKDTVLASATFSGAPPIARLPITPSLQVPMNAPKRLFLTYTIAPGAGVGDWIGARLPDATYVEVEFPDKIVAVGVPFDTWMPGSQTRIDASVDTVLVTDVSRQMPTDVTQWQADVPALGLTLDADRNLVDLAGFDLAVGGNAAAADVWLVKLVRDADRDGNFTAGTDAVLAWAAPSGGPPRVLLPFSLTVAAGFPASFLIFADLAPAAAIGAVLNLTLSATGIRLSAGSADLIGPANLPATSGDATIRFGPRPSLSVAWTDAPPSADGVWAFGEHLLGVGHTTAVDRPIGNGVPGLVTVENNGTMLFVAVDASGDLTNGTDDGVAIGFDTDGNGAPTAGADDVFVANATGGAHLRYNGTALAWTPVSACDAFGGNETTPACAAAFGPTELDGADHRFYEFALPLPLLGIATPVGPGTVLRFALAAPPHRGLVDGGNRSTWPLLYGAPPPLATFGDLRLAALPPPNVPPTLDWAGEPGYVTDGLEPETADAGLPFRWKISYTDPDDNPPALGQPRVSIYRDGSPISGSPYAMSGADVTDTVYSDGKTYVVTLILAQCGGTYTYTFTARDSRGAPAVATPGGSGPVVTCPNFPPTLSNPGVSPTSAPSGTAFTYRVLYADPEGVGPAVIDVRVRLDGGDVATQSLLFAGWFGGPTYVEGAWFDGTVLLVNESSNYTFRFRASDGTTLVTTPEFLGPQVAPPPPDTLHVSGYQLFPPLFVDEGTREVPFLHLRLWTTDPDVNVTSVQINRICGGPDGAIESILLYWDVDTSNSVSPGDVLLGMQPPLFANVFPLAPALNVTPSSSFDLLVVANVARPGIADATIGFQVPDASAVGVEPGDTVQPFGAISSDCASVNVAPRARNPTMDGHLSGTPPADHLLTATPPLGWVYEDDNSGDVVQVAYNVSVHSVSPSTLLWFRNETADVRSAPYAGPPLAIGTTYEVRVRVYDGRLWSLTATGTFRRNTPPAAPILASPPDLALDVDPRVTLTWSAITDAEGDPIAYTWWVSDSPAFTPATSGITTAASVPLSLQRSTQYYWKVGASDGYEFSGNATIWRFATAAEPVPVRGEVRGRVVNGTAPIAGALVELLNGTTVVAARITPSNGTFAIGDLDLLAYGVRVSAFGFHPRSLAAEPTQAAPIVDLSDIALTPITDGNGGNHEPPPVAWLPIAIPLALAVAALLAFLLVFRRRRSRRPRDTLAVEASPPDGPAPQSPPLAVTVVIPRDVDEPIRMSVPEAPEAPSPAAQGRRSEPPTGEELAFECPVCGRRVAADALACACGAVFEA